MPLKTCHKNWGPVHQLHSVQWWKIVEEKMEIAEFVPLAQRNKRSARSRKKALALKEETKSQEKAKRASKERGNLFGQISRQTGLSIEEVNYCFCLIILNSYVWVSFCRAGILAVLCPLFLK